METGQWDREGGWSSEGQVLFFMMALYKVPFLDVYFAGNAVSLETRDARSPVGYWLAGLGGVSLGRVVQNQAVRG